MLFDRAKIDGKAKITSEGYLVADALVARANNIQEYRAAEIGLTDRDPNAVVRVFRPEAVVFHKDALASASHMPITVNHPATMVDAKNWREFARGETGEEILRDGEFMRVPFRVTDAAGVNAVSTTHQEFSLGYAADMDFTPGVFNGQAYDAALKSITYNHLAAVPAARGGAELRIVDERTIHTDGERLVKKIMLDGLQVDLSDASAVETAITKLQGQLTDATTAKASLETQVATLTTDAATKDAEIVTLKKSVEDAKVTPQQMRDAAKAYALVCDKAKALGITVTDAMDESGIMKAVVDAKMGDVAKDWTADQVAASFAVLTKDAKVTTPNVHPIGMPQIIGDAAAQEQKAFNDANDFNAWRTAGKSA